MRNFVFVLVLFCFFVTALFSSLETLKSQLTDEQILLLIKEELQFTNDLLVAQQLASRAITLKQNFLKKRTGEIISDFDRLKGIANQDIRIDLEQIVEMRSSLDSLKTATQSVGAQIQGLILEMQNAKNKKSDNQKMLIQLAENIVRAVQNDKSPELPKKILQDLQQNLDMLKEANEKGQFDHPAYQRFVIAYDDYNQFLASKGNDVSMATIYTEQLKIIGKNIDEFSKQANEFQLTMDEYNRMLRTQEEANMFLEEELARIKAYAEERLYKEFVYFDSGSIEITEQYKGVLRDFAKEYKDQEGLEYHVIGYSDKDPIGGKLAKKYPTNWELSLARATASAKYLMEHLGVKPEQVIITGKGEYRPFFSDGAIDKLKSRRVEIKIVKIK